MPWGDGHKNDRASSFSAMPRQHSNRWRAGAVVLLALLAGVCMVLGHVSHESSAHVHDGMALSSSSPSKQSVPPSSDDHCDASSAAGCTLRLGLQLVGLVLLALTMRRMDDGVDRGGAIEPDGPRHHLAERLAVPRALASSGAVGLLCVSRT